MSLVIEAERVPLEAGADGVVKIADIRVPLDTVVHAFHNGATAEQIVDQFPSLELGAVYAVIAYYLRHRQAVDAYLEERQQQRQVTRQGIERRCPPDGIRARLMARRQTQE